MMTHFDKGRAEARTWAASKRGRRVQRRLSDFQAWLISANGDHQPAVQQHTLGYIAGLREVLS